MTLEVTVNEVLLKEDNFINEGEYNVKKINFEFSDEYTGLTKKCRFIMDEGTTYEEDILDNQCEIPVEVNAYDGYIKIGVYAYNEVEGVLELRYSPSPLKYLIRSGSFKTDGEIIKPERLITIEQSIDSDSEANVPSIHAVKKALDSLSVSGFEAGENITFEENEETKKTIINATDTIYDDTEIKDELNNKVDKVEGKGLSTNDYSDENKEKLASLENYDDTEVKQNIADLETNKADKTEIPDTSSFITKDVNNLTNYELKDNVGNSINLSIDSDTYVMALQLKNSSGDVISSGNVDLPLETMVVDATYDNDTKEIVLTLQSGTTTRFSVADLVSGLVSEETFNNKVGFIINEGDGNSYLANDGTYKEVKTKEKVYYLGAFSSDYGSFKDLFTDKVLSDLSAFIKNYVENGERFIIQLYQYGSNYQIETFYEIITNSNNVITMRPATTSTYNGKYIYYMPYDQNRIELKYDSEYNITLNNWQNGYYWKQFNNGFVEDSSNINIDMSYINSNIDLSSKQDTLTAGDNITIDENNVISASGGGNDTLIPLYCTIGNVWNYSSSRSVTFDEENRQKIIDYYNNYCDVDNLKLKENAPKFRLLSLNSRSFTTSENIYIDVILNVENIHDGGVQFHGITAGNDYSGSNHKSLFVTLRYIKTWTDPILCKATYEDIALLLSQQNMTSGNLGVLSIRNNIAYTPTNDYNPATKKYVDDKVASAVQEATNEEIDAIFESEGE